MNAPSESSPPPKGAHTAKWALAIIAIIVVALNLYYGFKLLNQATSPASASTSAETLKKAVPAFAFTNQLKAPVTNDTLKGKVWVASFVFTRCPGPCPIITANISKIQQHFSDETDLNFASFSIDPNHDTPEVLKAFAELHQADHSRWHFLTGNQAEIHDLSMNGFYSAVMEADEEMAKTVGKFVHGTRIYVVNREGSIVAAYDGNTPEGVEKTITKIQELL